MSKKTSFYVRQFSSLTQKQLQENLSFFMDRNNRFNSHQDQLQATSYLLKKVA